MPATKDKLCCAGHPHSILTSRPAPCHSAIERSNWASPEAECAVRLKKPLEEHSKYLWRGSWSTDVGCGGAWAADDSVVGRAERGWIGHRRRWREVIAVWERRIVFDKTDAQVRVFEIMGHKS